MCITPNWLLFHIVAHFVQTHTHNLTKSQRHLDNHSGSRWCFNWKKTAKKEIECVSSYWICASGLKETAAYKYLLSSLMLIKQQNTALTKINLHLIHTLNTIQCSFYTVITFFVPEYYWPYFISNFVFLVFIDACHLCSLLVLIFYWLLTFL